MTNKKKFFCHWHQEEDAVEDGQKHLKKMSESKLECLSFVRKTLSKHSSLYRTGMGGSEKPTRLQHGKRF